MAIVAIRLPDIGEGVTRAELVEWHVKPGDLVREDDPIAAVMTDKATVEIPSLYAGRIVELGGAIGDELAIGCDLVRIETDQAVGDEPPPTAPTAPELPPPAPVAAPPPRRPAQLQTPAPSGGPVPPRPEGVEPLASPSVRARAREGGIDLRRMVGSGPAGRITHDDLDAAFAGTRTDNAARVAARAPRQGAQEIKVVGMRRRIAERMALANARIPHITVIEEIDVTALEALREQLNSGRGDKPKLTILPFICATLTRALADHPEMNAHYNDEGGLVTRYAAVHLGIATQTDAGLMVPVLRHAEALGLFATAGEIARLSGAARSGSATRDELSGSTFTISSLGPLGALATTPIINHPEVAILGVNKIAVRPMWDGTQFQPRKMMNISASFDHRVIDGWDAAVFVQKLKTLIETPALIFLEEGQ